MLKMGRSDYQEYLKKYTSEKNYAALMAIYQNVLMAKEIPDEN
jgi:hypothetical protein